MLGVGHQIRRHHHQLQVLACGVNAPRSAHRGNEAALPDLRRAACHEYTFAVVSPIEPPVPRIAHLVPFYFQLRSRSRDFPRTT
ncbi:MAG TPA: hypothetical protein VFT22_29390 [Kofleriaceae bacterium]|nr:hypothetical protein [Kofleriaceae bacterium]